MTEGMGKTAVCSGCSQPFRIGSARPQFAWKSSDLGEDSWVGVEAPQEKKEIKHCIICQAPLDDDAVRCSACGANQITGLVHKRRAPAQVEAGSSILSILPMRLIALLLAVALVGAGVFWGIRSLFSSVADSGVELARHRIIMAAAKAVAGGADDAEFSSKFAGRVDNESLPRFLEMLEAGDPMIRKAAPLLIACGKVTQVGPIVAKARSPVKAVAEGAVQVLQAIGARRLVMLSNDADAQVRRSAAEGLCALFSLKADAPAVDELAEAVETAEKVERLNKLCRPWPGAVGTFAIQAGEQPASMTAQVEQIGRSFYLHVGSREFVSDSTAERTFVIPVEQWCAATGVAVDARQVTELISGRVTLTSPFGIGWEGEARVTARKDLSVDPPGFLPVGKLHREETVTLPVKLENE
jgi:hypothetical protein